MVRSWEAGFILGLAAVTLGLGLGSCSHPLPYRVVLCAGDSLTELGYPPLLQRLLRREGFRARVLNFGRKGFNSGEYLRFLKAQEKRLALTRPDYVLLELGTNDVRVDGDRTATAAFERNMTEVIRTFRSFRNPEGGVPVVFLATIPPVPGTAGRPFAPESSRRVHEEIDPALRRLAAELAVILVDVHALFVDAPELLPDVHPTPAGYLRMARLWLDALRPWMERPRARPGILPPPGKGDNIISNTNSPGSWKKKETQP